jgi:hypothetical protein
MTTMTIDPRQHALMGLCIETVKAELSSTPTYCAQRSREPSVIGLSMAPHQRGIADLLMSGRPRSSAASRDCRNSRTEMTSRADMAAPVRACTDESAP